jgi:geranylgeranyl diphosphate synthase, type II
VTLHVDLAGFQQMYKQKIEHVMLDFVNGRNTPSTIKDAMVYSLQAGGKRIRPILLLAVIEGYGKDIEAGMKTAAALELIHTYSLIHDDLPSMDDDDLRRGKPTNHKVFGEAMAILAGDGLLTHSFQLIAEDELITSDQKIKLLGLLAKCAGPEGMVGGQVADIEGENKSLTVDELESVHVRKTGKLLIFSALAGAIISCASGAEQSKLEQFAHHIGLAFQIQDDILDIEGTEELIGKRTGSDEFKRKSTYPGLLSMDGAKEKLRFHLDKALSSLEELSMDTALLKQIAHLIVNRNH